MPCLLSPFQRSTGPGRPCLRLLGAAVLAATVGWAAPPEAGEASTAVAPRPAESNVRDLIEEGVALSARLSPNELDVALADRLRRRNPGQDPAPNAALLAFRVGVKRLGDGDLETGLGLMRHAFEHGIVPRFPPDSRPRLSAAHALADACRVHGCPNLAEPLYEDLLRRARAQWGEAHPRALDLLRDLGDTQRRQKAYDVAERTLRFGLRSAEGEVQAPPEVLAPLHDVLALIYLETEQPERARTALEAALSQRSTLAPDHPARAAAAVALARYLLDHRRPTAAELALRPLLESNTPPDLSVVLIAGEVLFVQGRFDRAAATLEAGASRLSAELPATDPARLPWHYGLASAKAAAGHRDAARSQVVQAREIARAHPEAAAPFLARFLDLTARIDQLEALAGLTAELPPNPFAPPPSPPNIAGGKNAASAWRAAVLNAGRHNFAEALQAGERALALTGTGRLRLAGWASQAGRIDVALSWLTAAARLEGLERRTVVDEPGLSAVRADPRYRGLTADLDAVAMYWRQHLYTAQALAQGTDPDPDGLRWVLLRPAEPEGKQPWLVPEQDGPRVAPDRAVSLTGPIGLGPQRARFSGQPATDDAHLRRQLDRLPWPASPGQVVLVGKDDTAQAALGAALHDPDFYTAVVILSPLSYDQLDTVLSPAPAGAPSLRVLLRCPEGKVNASTAAHVLAPSRARVACLSENGNLYGDFVGWRAALNALRARPEP